MGWSEQSQGLLRRWRLPCLVILEQILKRIVLMLPSNPIQLEMALFPYYAC